MTYRHRGDPGNLNTRLFLHKREVAHCLGIGLSTLDKWVRRGLLPQPIKLGPKSPGWSIDSIKAFPIFYRKFA